ncbi:MAG: arsenate reductase ArsC [Clostridiales bacterium]|nr:arsenate reductase ArsC [Clostridiales bacterium]
MKKTVAFICIHNSCRSQMAEGWAKAIGSGVMNVYSAGTEQYPEVKKKAVQAMHDVGVDISAQYPKLLDEIPNEFDYVITMGCGVICPYIPSKHQEDWGIDDPSGGTMEDFVKARELIRQKVESLIEHIQGDI